jgi:hypothetical protein
VIEEGYEDAEEATEQETAGGEPAKELGFFPSPNMGRKGSMDIDME